MRAECTREKTGEALSVKIVHYGTLIYINLNHHDKQLGIATSIAKQSPYREIACVLNAINNYLTIIIYIFHVKYKKQAPQKTELVG